MENWENAERQNTPLNRKRYGKLFLPRACCCYSLVVLLGTAFHFLYCFGEFSEFYKNQLVPGASIPESNPVIKLDFTVQMFAASGLKVETARFEIPFADVGKVDSMNVINETYKPYKYVRSLTKAGYVQMRT